MDEQEFSAALHHAFSSLCKALQAAGKDQDAEKEDYLDAAMDCVSCLPEGEVSTKSFQDGMVLTSNAGFTITLPNGEEFQVTIVKSRHAKEG